MSMNWITDSPVSGILATGCIATITIFLLSRNSKNSQRPETVSTLDSKATPDTSSVNNSGNNSVGSCIGKPHPFASQLEYNNCVYLDYNATTPVFPEVTTAMLPFLTTCFGNPSSSHVFSQPCRIGLQTARSQIGALVNAKDPQNEIYLTSCGTESDNRAVDIAIHHFMQHKKKLLASKGVDMSVTVPHIITCITEHPAVICYLRVLGEEQRIRMTVLPVNSEGLVDVAAIRQALTPNTALVTIMHSNNEVGTLQPIREIGKCIRQFNQQQRGEACVLLHSDGAQSLGKVLADVQALDVDMFTIVGHKFGAPKGVGALYIRSGVAIAPMLVGGGQERGIRGGNLMRLKVL